MRKAHVDQVLYHLGDKLELPPEILRSFERPSGTAGFEAGHSYNRNMRLHLIWEAYFGAFWNTFDDDILKIAHTDPWAPQ